MLDNALFALIINTIIAGEATAGICNTPIKQAFQPTMQGVNSKPTAYLYKIGDRRYGYPKFEDVWDSVNSVMTHTETQQYETTFQISALSIQNPNTPAQLTASDLLNLIASILQSQAVVASLQAADVGIERVSDIRNPYFLDDMQQFEAQPSFDFVLLHKQIVLSTVDILQSINVGLYPV